LTIEATSTTPLQNYKHKSAFDSLQIHIAENNQTLDDKPKYPFCRTEECTQCQTQSVVRSEAGDDVNNHCRGSYLLSTTIARE
jgi:hypothetical protein